MTSDAALRRAEGASGSASDGGRRLAEAAQEKLNVIAETLAALMAGVTTDQPVGSKRSSGVTLGNHFCCSATRRRIATATTRPVG